MSGRRAFTLIELLAVIVIASLVLAMGGLSISAAADRTAMTRTIAALQHMDTRARLHARTGGQGVIVAIDPDSRGLRLVTSEGELLSSLSVPTTIEMTLEKSDHQPRIEFDARGRSIDYTVVLRTPQQSVRLTVLGLTAAIIESEDHR